MKNVRIILLGLLAAGAFMPGLGLSQAPDLTLDQVTGVNEGDYFFLGQTGMKGWIYWSSLTSESRQILVTEVRTNTPSSGVMQYHDVILGIDGGLFTSDARVAFVDAIVDAQATGNNGELNLTVFRPSLPGQTNITLTLKEMGTRNEATTPYNCPWVDGVLSNYCEYVYTNGPTGYPTKEPSIWAMLASGELKYVDWAANYITNQSYASRTTLDVYRDTGQKVWYTGYQLITLCQYYLLTSDSFVLPAIEDTANFIAQGQDLHGLWGHTMAWPANNGGELHGTLPGYGALNQAGLAGLYGLVLAQRCGVSDPEVDAAVTKSAHFFRAHVDLGAINYGYHSPAWGVTDSNGRMGIAAHLFRALDDPEAAKWFAMMTSTYKWRDWGHTGNEFNHCWGPMAASVGGPDLANYIHTERAFSGPFWLTSLVNRQQWEGNFQSQGQEGRGKGRSNGHATGGYGIQLAGNRHEIEITGAGYDTNQYWLTAAEMAEVEFALPYESNSSYPTNLTDGELLANIDNFCTKVGYKIGDELGNRAVTDASLRATLVSIVEDTGASDRERVVALKALDTADTNILVKATTDTWWDPSAGYVLNWGAANFADASDVTSWTNILSAILAFDPDLGFEMLTAQKYASQIANMDLSLLDTVGSNLYYDATGFILDPDVGGGAFVSGQDVKNWDPLIIARYADEILRSAELYALPYADAPVILEHNQIGEGMHSAMVRGIDYTPQTPDLEVSAVDEYGDQWWPYTNFTRSVMVYNHRVDEQYKQRHIIEFVATDPKPQVQWFRDLIATNIVNTLTNPATLLADLRYNITLDEDDDLFNAVCLSMIASHPDNADPFIDITNSLGSIIPITGSHWRHRKGAVELGIADTNDVSRWMAALTEAETAGDNTVMAGILHVLAGKGAAAALPEARRLLLSADDYVAMGALDVIEQVGTANELLMVFENYMTNSVLAVDESGVAFKNDYWLYSHWDAAKALTDRDYAGCLAVASSLATSFNTYTSNGTDYETVPYGAKFRAEPFDILNPVMEDRPVNGWGVGVYHILGLFSRDNTDCETALVQLVAAAGDPYYNRQHDFRGCEALMQVYSIPEIVAIENAGGNGKWNQRGAMYYLIDQLVLEKVAASNQLDLLNVRNGEYQTSSPYYYNTYQREMTYRRGLEESDGMFFFGLD